MAAQKKGRIYSAPGRVCLFGEHQDYLNLVVVPAAINLRTNLEVNSTTQKRIEITSLDLSKKDSFEPTPDLTLANNEFDYFRAIVKVLFNKKIVDNIPGFNITISSKVPIGSGLSSSAAILVAFLTALNEELNLELDREEIANLCFIAENKILGINCGIMDQYSSALGGLFSLDCDGPPYEIKQFQTKYTGLVIGDSLVRRKANKPLTKLKTELSQGLEELIANDKTLKQISLHELQEMRDNFTRNQFKRLYGAIRIRDITTFARKELAKKNQNVALLGELLTEQQRMLKDYLQVSIPKLDLLVKAAIKAGAKGAKLTGAGLGGCMVALAPGKEKEVAQAINQAGGKATICDIDFDGTKAE